MNVTLSLDDDLVKKVRKIAVERDTTLTGLIRQHLETLAAAESDAAAELKRRQLEKLQESFQTLSFPVGKKTWTRADLYDRDDRRRP